MQHTGSHDETMSPCVRVCRIAGNVCIGCQRTLDEIECWPIMSDQAKVAVLSRIEKSMAEKYFRFFGN